MANYTFTVTLKGSKYAAHWPFSFILLIVSSVMNREVPDDHVVSLGVMRTFITGDIFSVQGVPTAVISPP